MLLAAAPPGAHGLVLAAGCLLLPACCCLHVAGCCHSFRAQSEPALRCSMFLAVLVLPSGMVQPWLCRVGCASCCLLLLLLLQVDTEKYHKVASQYNIGGRHGAKMHRRASPSRIEASSMQAEDRQCASKSGSPLPPGLPLLQRSPHWCCSRMASQLTALRGC